MEGLVHVPPLVSLDAVSILPRECPNLGLLGGSLSSTPLKVCLGMKTLTKKDGTQRRLLCFWRVNHHSGHLSHTVLVLKGLASAGVIPPFPLPMQCCWANIPGKGSVVSLWVAGYRCTRGVGIIKVSSDF